MPATATAPTPVRKGYVAKIDDIDIEQRTVVARISTVSQPIRRIGSTSLRKPPEPSAFRSPRVSWHSSSST